ncbi:MAG: peptidylprolyl isomerase, partial [Desulfobacterales bacterium]
ADRIVVIVNDDIIVLSEVDQMLIPYRQKVETLGISPEKQEQALFGVREKILDQLIDDKLRDQEIISKELTVDERDVDAAIERVKQESYLTNEELQKALAQEGMTLDGYRQQVREQLLRGKLMNTEIRSKILVTQEDIKAYYEKHSDTYGGKTQVHLRHIIMKASPLGDGVHSPEIRKRIDAVWDKLRAGESFESMAEMYSESPLAETGGDLGRMELDTLSKQIRAAVEDLKPGEFTVVMDTDQGFQIFLLQEKVTSAGVPLEDVSEEIANAVYNEISSERYQSWIEALRERAHIKIIR